MTTAVKHLIESFEQLSTNEKREAVREILQRSVNEPHEPLSDDALIEIAEESFLELDRREAANETA
jgi:DNA-directed RNA polymerase specialized sigma54-like protein